ncbi:hypothetical protein SAMN05216281_109120 [Cryobacterium luteum]|nr:hypothetical protein SAMN05216281_109120 [Cryobacterium luteum]
MIMQGSSALERVSAEALDAAMTTYYEDNKDHASRADVFDAPVMLAGFSQGGIVAAAFAENRSDTYNVVQVLTAGSPIGNFDIPHDISVIASEADPVSGADGTQNPERWETLTADNGGGGGLGSHDVLRYALLAESAAGTPQEQNKLDDFLGVRDDRVISDYYAVKESK